MDHLRPSSLHPSLGRAGSREPPSGWRSQGPDHSHTTHARTHRQTQRKQEGALTWITSGPAACTHRWAELAPESLPPAGGPAACTHRWAELAPESLPPAGGHRGLITVTLHTHAHTGRHRGSRRGPDMDHLRPSSLHPSLGRAGSREPPSGWRSQGPDHSHTTHARTHRQTQGALTWSPQAQQPAPIAGQSWLQRASLRLEVTGA
ncbi:hypothetical protein D5F01_LYC25172 [Larimichthys crocea]|uniref:Uncharacterized protein n=1 Tax=Larimichthys crocea TaxID=215358 RepID=A0A6G0HDI3_LARCR|nr:hypothetical protein D5F01_LYC25172 [Larimichthys crocea]